jgi:SAM-dependent MidA family methyltransferase
MTDGPSLRRLPRTEVEDIEGDPSLEARIHDEIAANGPITFARFMKRALYEPEHGYYRSAEERPGRGGDFLTAPEADPIFGRAIARFVESAWNALERPARFVVREHGAGGGALAEPLLSELAATSPDAFAAVRYRVAEVEPRRLDAIARRLETAGLDDVLEPDGREPIVGVVIANEVLDALPTHRVVARGSDLRELFVDSRNGRLIEVDGPPSSLELAARLDAEGVVLSDGQQAEICLELDSWIATAAAGLARGIMLLIDYGDEARQLYDPIRRPAGTLLAYRGHRAHDRVLASIGRQDLTAHVDVTAVRSAARAAGLDHLATTTQGRFLAELGAGELLVELQGAGRASLGEYLTARSALVRMIDPAAMGSFKVMVFGRRLAAGVALRGLGGPDPGRPHQTAPN